MSTTTAAVIDDKTIAIAFRPGPQLSHHEMHEFQGEGDDELKVLDEESAAALESEILDTGFAFAPHVWLDPADSLWKIVDAHQRKKVLKRLEAKGYTIPKFHTVEVLADSFEQAKRRVLQAASQYGRATDRGLASFAKSANINFDALGKFRFPEVKLTHVQTHLRALNTPALTPEQQAELEDAVAEPPKVAKTKRGDLWLLGEHRLLCGDSTSREDVERLLGGRSIKLTLTDPPYSVDYDKTWETKGRGGNENVHRAYSWDAKETAEKILTFLNLVPSDVLVMSYPVDRHLFHLAAALKEADLILRKELVWVKNIISFWMGAKYQQKHEPILLCTRPNGRMHAENVPADQATVFEFPKPRSHDLHPTAKPVELWEKFVLYHTEPGEDVLDFFGGSGTTMICAEKNGRRSCLMEIEPIYCDVILERFAKFSGKDPVREDGVRWSAL